MLSRGYLLYKCQREHPKANQRNAHLFLQKQYDTDRLIKIYRFLLKNAGHLKKMTRDVNLFFIIIIFTYFGTSHNFDK